MLARIEGGSVAELTPKLNGKILLSAVSPMPPVEGVALSLDAAQWAHVMRSGRDWGLLAVAALMSGTLFFVPRDQLVACIVIVLVTFGGLFLMALRYSENWRTEARLSAADMPAPGTPVRIDGTGLTIGSVTTPWQSLKLAGVSLRKVRSPNGQMFRRYYVDQLLLDTEGGRVALDGAAIARGQRIVDAIFNQLCPTD